MRKIITMVRMIMDKETDRLIITLKQRPMVKRKDKIVADGGLAFSIIQIIVTLKCTLRCRKCATLMQHFADTHTHTHHGSRSETLHTPRSHVIRDIDAIMSKVDYTLLLNFVGGEPFLVKNLSEHISYAVEKHSEKFGMIVITTNGTIVPSESELRALAKNRKHIYVRVSDYGEKSAKLPMLEKALKKHRIRCVVDNGFEWREWQQIVDGEAKDDDYAKTIYEGCIAKENCNMVLGGKYYHCGFLMSGEALRAFPYSKDNSVDILDPNTAKSDIIKYKSNDKIPPGCRWCSGQSEDAPIVPKAEQAPEPVAYKAYAETYTAE